MKPKLQDKRWSKDFEKPLYEEWKRKKLYAFNRKSRKPVFSIDTPPPYVNTPVHIGQATTYILMDFFARFKRMTGNEVLFPLGLDRNGLPIEMAAEKRFKVKLTSLPRRKAIALCKRILEESSMASTETFLRSGISFNSWVLGKLTGDVYYTDSPEYRALTQGTFIDMWKAGLIYEDERVCNFCPGCRTTIADAEVEYRNLPSTFNDIVFRCKETGEKIIIGTTRPELVCTCGMVIFNPNDKRYKHLEGKTAITPVFEKEVPIRSHPAAEMEKGTGIMMMCSFGDLTDIRFFREMKLEPVIAIDKSGKMNRNAGILRGLGIEKARQKMIEELKRKKLLVGQKRVSHRTPVCERSKDPIEFISMKEFYVRQIDQKPKMKEMAKKLKFFSPRSRQILIDWINTVSIDWPISRRRYYATEIPLWYCKKCGEPVLPPKGRYYQPWQEKAPIKKCPKCGGGEFRGEERVFDTWFDSSISPLYILMYDKDDDFFRKHSPCTLRPQGKEIIRTWLYYTLLKCYLLTKKSIFRDVWINYHIVDERGHKMSKSVGNVIDPADVIDRFGAEPLRLWAAIEGNLTRTDFRCSFERIEGAGKTLTKLWNVARFISMFQAPEHKPKLMETDTWILHEANKLVEFAGKCYENYDFHNPAVRIKHFLWETFASHYIELVKSRAYNQNNKFSRDEQDAAIYTLNKVLDIIMKLMAPVIPFITYIIYRKLHGKDIHFTEFPVPEKTKKPGFDTDTLLQLNSRIWKKKRGKGLSLKSPIKTITIPQKFRGIEKDFKETHNIQEIKYS